MLITRRAALLAGASSVIFPSARTRAQSRPVIRVGVINDMSGTYRDQTGPTGVACARQAAQEFNTNGAFDVEVLSADHQNKPDIAVGIARKWFDQDGVDVLLDCAASSAALAMASLCKEKNKVMIATSTATSDITGKACTPNSLHWVYDTYMVAKSTGTATVKAGGNKWYFVYPNYAFGEALHRDTARFVQEAGGAVAGAETYAFPETHDFSSALIKARASGANVLGFCGSGIDLINIVKQAAEFGVTKDMSVAAMIAYTNDVRSIGLDTAQGLKLTECYYWDLNNRTRAFNDRVKDKVTLWPNMSQAGNYSAAMHYLKTVADIGATAAKADGAATVMRMKAIPTDDDVFGPGRIREDGRKIHPAYLFEVKKPSESKQEWDLYRLIGSTPAEEAFRPLSERACPLIKA
jgi:branched-chain amino acid transport system substrate-binding protein